MNEDNFVTYTAHRHAIGDGAASVTCGSFTMDPSNPLFNTMKMDPSNPSQFGPGTIAVLW